MHKHCLRLLYLVPTLFFLCFKLYKVREKKENNSLGRETSGLLRAHTYSRTRVLACSTSIKTLAITRNFRETEHVGKRERGGGVKVRQ